MMNQETIHIRKLTTGYPGKGGTKIVAKDIDATIRSGELTCLLGANGVGKSTLLRTLSAFQNVGNFRNTFVFIVESGV